MRRMLAAMLVLGVGTLGVGLLRGTAQTALPSPIGPNEKPIAESKPQLPLKPTTYELPKLESVDSNKEAARGMRLPMLPDGEPAIELPLGEPKLLPTEPLPKKNLSTPPPPIDLTPPEIKVEPMPVPLPKPIPMGFDLPLPAPPMLAPKIEEIKLPTPEKVKEPAKYELPSVPPSKAEFKLEPEVKPEVKEVTPKAPIPAVQPTKSVAPSVTVEVNVPESVGIGQQLDYEIVVKNTGPVTVHQVRIEDEFPKTVKYVGGDPVAEVQGDKLTWSIGSLEVNTEKRIKVGVKPGVEGDWRTRPLVTFSAQVMPVQVKVTRPKIQVAVTTPGDSAFVGEEVPFTIEIKNAGTGTAEKLTLRAQLSEGLFHPQAKEAFNRVIEAELNQITAGETRTITLKAKVMKPGSQGCLISAVTEGSPEASGRTTIQATPPSLNLKITGPQRGLVRTEPSFMIEVANTEKTPSAPVQVATAFPEGLEFVSATEGGSYDAEKRIVTWNLGGFQANQKRTVTLRTRAVSSGNWAIRAVAQAGPRQEVKAEWVIQTEGIPGLNFEVVSKENPVEVNKEATFEIRLVNQGTSGCTNIRLTLAMSEGLTPTSVTMGDNAVNYKMNGAMLTFDPIPKLGGQTEMTIRIKARGTQAGDLRCKVQMVCDQLKQPVVKEESTFFFMQ